MKEAGSPLIFKRRVIHVAGFEPIAPETVARRLTSGLKRFAPLWGAKATRSEPELAPDGRTVTFDVDAAGPNWTTRCRYTVLRWDELMAPYVGRPWLSRVVVGYGALVEFALTGTIRRYFRANLRYGLFVIYPFLVLAGCALLAVLLAMAAIRAGVPVPWLSAPLVALVAFGLTMRFLGSFFYLDFALADWAFAADLARRDVAGLDAVLDRFAEEVLAAAEDREADEVLLSSISLGAVMMSEAIARALARDPAICLHNRKLAFLTVGSSILKIGLHPAAKQLRDVVGKVGGEKPLFWVEYQAKVDFINFYRTDPVADLGNPATGKPLVHTVRIREMMSDDEYRRAQRNSLLLHRQFVMPNGRRYYYDFYQICFGPMAMTERIRLGNQVVGAFAEDGSYAAPPKPVRPKPALAAGE
jgi:hypothetical protein